MKGVFATAAGGAVLTWALLGCGSANGPPGRTEAGPPCDVSQDARGGVTVRCGAFQADIPASRPVPPIKARRVALAPGSECLEGGVTMLFGYDEDGDGVLGDHEVTDTLVECGREMDDVVLRYGGNLVIDSAPMLAAASLYTHIDGDVTYAYDGPVDTIALPRLREVAGNFVAHGHPQLRHMAGLRALQRIGGTLQLTDDAGLVTLGGLDKLAQVGGLVIANNPSLEHLDGLPALTRVSGAVLVSHNPNLRVIDAMAAAPPEARGALGGPVQVADNPRLERVAGFDNFTRGGGDIWLHDNRRLLQVSGFGALGVVEGNIKLMGLERLTEVTAFGVLEAAGGVRVQRNTVLTGLSGFGALVHVARDLAIVGNPGLVALTGFGNVALVGGALRVTGNPMLRGLDGLGALVQAQTLDIQNNLALAHVEGLRSLTAVGASVRLRGNPILSHVGGLRALASVAGDVVITEQGALRNLDGLLSLSHVGGSLCIAANGALQDMNGLRGLDSIVGDLLVRDNASLDTLEGLTCLRSVGGRVDVSNNPALSSDKVLELSRLGEKQGGLSPCWDAI